MTSIMQYVLVARETVVIGQAGQKAEGLSAPYPFLNPTHLSIRKGRATTTHYAHHQVSLMVSRNTTVVPSLGLCATQKKKERKVTDCVRRTDKHTDRWRACA